MADEPPVSAYEQHRRRGRRMADFALKLPVAAVRDHLTVGRQGRVWWSVPAGAVGEVAFTVVGPADPLPAVVLRYGVGDGRRVETTVRLTGTRTRFGGRRAWFLCPHVRDGGVCGRRVGTLYRPPGEERFDCRACHALTYYTSRRAHQVERLVQRMAGRDVPDFFAEVIDLLSRDGVGTGRRTKARKGRSSRRTSPRETANDVGHEPDPGDDPVAHRPSGPARSCLRSFG